MNPRRRSLLLGLACLPTMRCWGSAGAWPSTIRLSSGASATDTRPTFPKRLLSYLLEQVGWQGRFELRHGLSQQRVKHALADDSLDVGILPSLGIDAHRLAYLRYPLRRGLLGLRLLVVQEARAAEFAGISELGQLKRLRLGMGRGWSEVEPLRGLGFNITTTRSYPGLFDLLRSGRIDYLSRAVSEVWSEQSDASLDFSGLSVAPEIAMFYPLDEYFMVKRERGGMLAGLEAPLREALRSGAYWRLLTEVYGEDIERSDIPSRRIFQVQGFGVEEGTPLELFDAFRLEPSRGVFRIPER
jgi:hypothetical protein